MKITGKKIKYLSKITNSIYEDLKIEFLYHSNHLEGSTFSKDKLDKLMLFHWHKTLKKGTVDDEINNTGMWKKYENKLRGLDLKLAYPNEVDNLMENLLLDWNELNIPSTEDIATFHYKFEMIHPFQDENESLVNNKLLFSN